MEGRARAWRSGCVRSRRGDRHRDARGALPQRQLVCVPHRIPSRSDRSGGAVNRVTVAPSTVRGKHGQLAALQRDRRDPDVVVHRVRGRLAVTDSTLVHRRPSARLSDGLSSARRAHHASAGDRVVLQPAASVSPMCGPPAPRERASISPSGSGRRKVAARYGSVPVKDARANSG